MCFYCGILPVHCEFSALDLGYCCNVDVFGFQVVTAQRVKMIRRQPLVRSQRQKVERLFCLLVKILKIFEFRYKCYLSCFI